MAEQPKQNESALILVIPEAEELVSALRMQYDPSAPLGVPAHVTVLYPFKPPEAIDEAELMRLKALFASQAGFRLRFEDTARFPDVLYLRPTPWEPLLALIRLVAAQYPDYPPYGGEFPEVIPHLTIAQQDDEALLERLDAEVTRQGQDHFPIESQIRAVALYEEQAGRWEERAAFPLGNPT